MKKIMLASMLGFVITSGNALAVDAYPQSPAFVDDQSELNAMRALGTRDQMVRDETQNSRKMMLVYPSMFVHVEDGVVTSWSDH